MEGAIMRVAWIGEVRINFIGMIGHFLALGMILFFSLGKTFAAPFRLAEEDNGRTNTVKVADTVEITLPGNPTTGYEWGVFSFNTNILQKTADAQYRQAKLPGGKFRVGVGGQFTFRFKAVAPGKGDIKLIYRRNWETTACDRVYSVSIDVR